LHINRAFLDLVQVGGKGSVVGESLQRWLGRPGADLKVLLANVERYGMVRTFTTTMQGELGTETEVEISATGNAETDFQHVAVLIRDVSQRLPRTAHIPRAGVGSAPLTEQIGKTPLRQLIKEAVGEVERRYIEAALALTEDNRTAAAEILGLSRQSLYAKLNRYGIDGGAQALLNESD
jgi:transcriptional regulator PpsR